MTEFTTRYEAIVHRLAPRFPQPHPDHSFSPPVRSFAGNLEVIAAACALLHYCEDVAPFVMAPLLDARFDLAADWGIDSRPLFSRNNPQRVQTVVQQRFGSDVHRLRPDNTALLDALHMVNAVNLIGKATGAKMAYLKPITGTAFRNLTPDLLADHFSPVVDATVDLLNRQKRRLCRQAIDCLPLDMMVRQLISLQTVHTLVSWYAACPRFRDCPDLFYQVYADRVAQLLHDQHCRSGEPEDGFSESLGVLRGEGVETVFVSRNRAFIDLGDRYGDCTAGEVRSQVDPQVANIHWTVYTWLLDPLYRVLEVCLDGRPVLKGHLLPLVIHDRKVLMVDAIETIPSLRDVVRGRPNPNRSERVYARRLAILEGLFRAARELAEAMGMESVYVDKYSNTRWVRTAVDQLPSDSYHVSDVVKPYGNRVITEVIADLIGSEPVTVCEEIQAANLTLMDQYLQANHKEIGVLMGRREEYSLAIRGI